MDRDKLLALIKKETGIRIDVEDPVLAVAVLHEKILEVALERVETTARRASAEMSVSASQAVTLAQQSAGRIVTDSTEWVIEQLRAAGAEIAATLVHETQAEVAKAEAARAGAVRAAWIAGAVSAVGAAAVGGLALAALRFA